ncbi:MAG TPA: hypothetical protein VJ965_04610, partial [Anaerolineales bacterium]|nr:hypothetical protein [Anaerolineales bacterium]
VTAGLFGYALAECEDGYTLPCPFCAAHRLHMYCHNSLWLFECECGKQGDVMDFVGWLVIGEAWSPTGMAFDEMAGIVLTAIQERLADE